MVTMKEIAAKLGIAISTVSKGLNGANDISEELRQHILDTAIEMGYIPKNLRKEHLKKLCIFVENMDYLKDDDFGYDIILGFKQMALRYNWTVEIIPLNPMLQSQEKYDTFMLKNGYSGALLLGLALHDDWMEQLKTTTIPSVLFDNHVSHNLKVGFIGTDSYEGIDLCVAHLVKLGHTKIAFLNGSPNSLVTTQRQEAFLSSMKANHLEIDENLMEYGYYTADCAKYHVPTFLSHGATAVICSADLIAQGVMEECKLRGFNVPEDISVTGFDDLPIASELEPPLTTIRQDRILLGKSGYNTLEGLLHNLPLSKTLLRAQLIVRSTTAPVRPRNNNAIIKKLPEI